MKRTIITIYRLIASILTFLLIIYFAFQFYGIHSSGLGNAISNIVAPILGPIQGIVPCFLGIDFSPLILISVLSLIDWLLRSLWTDEPISY